MFDNARIALEASDQFPYDGDTPTIDWAHRAARGVLEDLWGRRSIGNILDDIEIETRIEIVEAVAGIIRAAHAGDQT